MGCSYDWRDCLITVIDKEDPTNRFVFKWYQNTSERDLNLYFRDIVDSLDEIKNKKKH